MNRRQLLKGVLGVGAAAATAALPIPTSAPEPEPELPQIDPSMSGFNIPLMLYQHNVISADTVLELAGAPPHPLWTGDRARRMLVGY